MNRGLLAKSFGEIWPLTLAIALLLFVAELAVAFMVRQIGANEFASILQSELVRRVLSGMIGTRVTAEIGRHLAQTLPWIHPLTMLILFSHCVMVATQIPVGEIDRGTIDVLLGAPVSRLQAYASHSLVWIGSGIALMLAGVAGNWCGAHLANDRLAAPAHVVAAFLNGFCLYLAIGGFCFFVSTITSRRGRAVGAIIAVLVVLVLFNAVADAYAPAEFLNLLTPMNYFRPIFIFRDGAWPVDSMVKLVVTGLIFWGLGGIQFERRDLHTV